ncbi:DNA-binding protein WhiA [Peptoniphilus catoniae]|uniref:DNA-binding protein WhiA n=1 Tax=Peptoniphilus catoniae TaxID=1660341 RepID=UPI0010FF3D33|nr:DNA-binding protein WhiA [Peptoniphilus catoniae]
MSFSSYVKSELAKIPIENNCDIIAELAAFVPMCASLSLAEGGLRIGFNTESAAVARRIFTFLKGYYSEDVVVKVSKSRQLKKNNIYSVMLEDSGATNLLLDDVNYIRNENVFMPNYAPEFLLRDRCCRRAYIRGSFLGAGSISDPKKYYHLEFVCNRAEHAEFLSNLINSFGFRSKFIARKDSYIVYLKEAEQISDLLSLTGAYRSTLEFENVRVFKDINNRVNRIVNLESANLNKIVDTNIRQVRDIELIDKVIGLDNLPDNLRQVAQLRLEDRSLSLRELGKRLSPPIGKSGVNHRLKRIKDIADSIRSERDGG